MASSVLYAPTVEPYTVSQVDSNKCRVYFKISDYNTREEWAADDGNLYVHAAVYYQKNGLSAVAKNANYEVTTEANTNKLLYTSTGIFLNLPARISERPGMYMVDIPGAGIYPSNISRKDSIQEENKTNKWESGVIYKIQLRLSKKRYSYDTERNRSWQSEWLDKNAEYFSEWSTITITKITSTPTLLISNLGYDSRENNAETNQFPYPNNVLELDCNYLNEDITETLYSYRFTLYDVRLGRVIEDSGEHIMNKYQYTTHFVYKFKHELEDGNYYVKAYLQTINKYNKTYTIRISASPILRKEVDLRIKYAETDQDGSLFTELWFNEIMNYKDKVDTYVELQNYDKSLLSNGDVIKVMVDKNYKNATTYYRYNSSTNNFDFINTNAKHVGKIITSKDMEEEEGIFCLKIFDPAEAPSIWDGILTLRRTDEDSNFEIWDDLQYIKLERQMINDLPNFYDYTLESGKTYMYCLQYEDVWGSKTGNLTASITAPIKRKFEHTYLLGENNEYLPIKFNTNLNNYQLVRQDTLTPTLGSRYPYFTRAAAPKYKQFEMSGTISFHMDECELFLQSGDIYGYGYYETGDKRTNTRILDDDGIQVKGINYKGHWVDQYEEIEFMDYYLEKKFREKVIEFLTNGRPKLYRSSSEPNMIVMVTNASFTPNQQLGRLIYDFSCTCTEIDECIFANYLTYKFIEYNDVSVEKKVNSVAMIGQITGVCKSGTNLMEIIKRKYDGSGKDDGSGYENILTKITDIDIQIFSRPSVATVSEKGNFYGWKLQIQNKDIIIDYRTHRYALDPIISLSPEENIFISDAAYPNTGEDSLIEYEINFIYYIHKIPYVEFKILSSVESPVFGQYRGVFAYGDSLYRDIYLKYFRATDENRIKLKYLTTVKIESEPGATFEITDNSGGIEQMNLHEVPPTGYLIIDDTSIGNIVGITYKGVRIKNMQGEYEYIARKTTGLIDFVGIKVDEKIETKKEQ